MKKKNQKIAVFKADSKKRDENTDNHRLLADTRQAKILVKKIN